MHKLSTSLFLVVALFWLAAPTHAETERYGAWLRVNKSWKGVSSRTIYLFTGNLRNDCDPSFGKRGERWLVFGQLSPLYRYQNSKTPYTRKLMAHGCYGTVVFAEAAEELRALAALRR